MGGIVAIVPRLGGELLGVLTVTGIDRLGVAVIIVERDLAA